MVFNSVKEKFDDDDEEGGLLQEEVITDNSNGVDNCNYNYICFRDNDFCCESNNAKLKLVAKLDNVTMSWKNGDIS